MIVIRIRAAIGWLEAGGKHYLPLLVQSPLKVVVLAAGELVGVAAPVGNAGVELDQGELLCVWCVWRCFYNAYQTSSHVSDVIVDGVRLD